MRARGVSVSLLEKSMKTEIPPKLLKPNFIKPTFRLQSDYKFNLLYLLTIIVLILT